MHTFTVTYTIKYQIDFAEEYAFNQYNECWNLKTGRKIKKISNNGCLGYKIRSKFYSLSKLRNHLVKPSLRKCPF